MPAATHLLCCPRCSPVAPLSKIHSPNYASGRFFSFTFSLPHPPVTTGLLPSTATPLPLPTTFDPPLDWQCVLHVPLRHSSLSRFLLAARLSFGRFLVSVCRGGLTLLSHYAAKSRFVAGVGHWAEPPAVSKSHGVSRAASILAKFYLFLIHCGFNLNLNPMVPQWSCQIKGALA